MEKLDLTKKYKVYYTARPTPEVVDIGPASYLSITGKGDPDKPQFAERVGALYAAAYAVKFNSKMIQKDFTVPTLEGLWWFDKKKFGTPSAADAAQKIPRAEWLYRLLIRMPEFVTANMVSTAISSVIAKKTVPVAADVEHFEMTEGKCIQVLHKGPFATEPVTLKVVYDFMQVEGLSQNGYHHEIYLSDFRRTAPEKLKTILREPVR